MGIVELPYFLLQETKKPGSAQEIKLHLCRKAHVAYQTEEAIEICWCVATSLYCFSKMPQVLKDYARQTVFWLSL